MSSVSKGNYFENLVFRNFKEELESDNLFVSGKTSKIFKKKGYFSRDRGTEIITDISIETFMPDAKEYSLLTIIECKDYGKSIPVNEIEELYSKVQQIGGLNVKAIFATTCALQKSALAYAMSKKIGIIRYMPDEQVQWVVRLMTFDSLSQKKEISYDDFDSAFLVQDHVGFERSFYACDEKSYFGNLYSMLKKFLNEN